MAVNVLIGCPANTQGTFLFHGKNTVVVVVVVVFIVVVVVVVGGGGGVIGAQLKDYQFLKFSVQVVI